MVTPQAAAVAPPAEAAQGVRRENVPNLLHHIAQHRRCKLPAQLYQLPRQSCQPWTLFTADSRHSATTAAVRHVLVEKVEGFWSSEKKVAAIVVTAAAAVAARSRHHGIVVVRHPWVVTSRHERNARSAFTTALTDPLTSPRFSTSLSTASPSFHSASPGMHSVSKKMKS